MAMRRPRIKAAANLVNIKRKPKVPLATPTDNVGIVQHVVETEASKKESSIVPNIKEDVAQLNIQSDKECNLNETTPLIEKTITTEISNSAQTNHENSNLNEPKANERANENIDSHVNVPSPANESAFKQPTKIENYRQTSVIMPLGSPFNNYGSNATYKSEDVYHSDIDNNIMQMNLQRTVNGYPMSPTKQQQQTRPRIRPSPIIGQRRNSYVGSSPSPHTANSASEESSNDFIMPSPRRERHHSTSLTFTNSSVASPHKYMPISNSRIRTDSNCSAFSDVIVTNSAQITTNPLMQATKVRKTGTNNEMSNNRINWLKDYESRCPNGVPDKARLKMFDLIYYNPTTNPMDIKHNDNNKSQIENSNKIENNTKIEEINEKKKTTAPVPQLKLNANNELVLDDKSLEIETTAEQEAKKVLANTSLVFVDENTGTNGFYRRKKRTKEWPQDETIRFYRCLQTVGTDFSIMEPLFPLRSRRDLKLKFKKEERYNGALINKAILYPKNFDIDQLKQQLEVEDHKREEELRKWHEINAKIAAKAQKVNR